MTIHSMFPKLFNFDILLISNFLKINSIENIIPHNGSQYGPSKGFYFYWSFIATFESIYGLFHVWPVSFMIFMYAILSYEQFMLFMQTCV